MVRVKVTTRRSTSISEGKTCRVGISSGQWCPPGHPVNTILRDGHRVSTLREPLGTRVYLLRGDTPTDPRVDLFLGVHFPVSRSLHSQTTCKFLRCVEELLFFPDRTLVCPLRLRLFWVRGLGVGSRKRPIQGKVTTRYRRHPCRRHDR